MGHEGHADKLCNIGLLLIAFELFCGYIPVLYIYLRHILRLHIYGVSLFQVISMHRST